MRADLPSGTVTFLFTDVEKSTKLLRELGEERYAEALAGHRRILREAFQAQGGVEVDTQGDAFFYAFPTAPGALEAASQAVQGLAETEISVRVGIHTGTPLLTDGGYVGHDVHKAARIAAAGHGGQILVSASTASLIAPSDTVSQGRLRDLGEHRLKDLSAPERIYQVGEVEFPPLETLYQTNLPIPATPFLGRERELGEVVSLLGRDDSRLLTLTGPGGSGKTRLALQSAAVLAELYPQGVWWVPLAPLRDPELVLESASQTLGAKDGPADFIQDKRLLLLFDNFEHLLEAAGDLSELLSSCPNLDVLVTSREPLHLSGEREYEVPPLAHEEAVGFFASRARAVDAAFEVDDAVAGICERLDDLPLALELAAARVKALTSRQILDRLQRRLPLLTGGARDAPERQRTLRATIEWSHELLSEDEQRLFARLAVFRSGCTIEAAEDVAGADLDTLQSLVDKSLVRHRDGRYWMLETIREYAAEQLRSSGDAEELRRHHAEHFLALAEDAEPSLRGDPKEWLDRLDRDHDNLRAALDYLGDAEAGDAHQRLAGALWRFWAMRGHLAEGRRRLESALEAGPTATLARGKTLNGATVLALETGDPATARSRAEEALTLHRALDDAWGTAVSVQLLGNVLADERDHEGARQLFQTALELFRELGDEHYLLLQTRLLAWMHFELGDIASARALHEDVVRRARESGNVRLVAGSMGALGEYAVEEGRIQDAIPLLAESFRLSRDLDERPEILVGLWRFARALAVAGRAADAARMFSAAETLRDRMGAITYTWVEAQNADTLDRIRSHLDDPAFAQAWEQGKHLTLDDALALALGEEASAERDEAGLVEP